MECRWPTYLYEILFRPCNYGRTRARHIRYTHSACSSSSHRPSIAPKPAIDIKHIRQNPLLYRQNCIDRNYEAQSKHPSLIVERFELWKQLQQQARHLRERSNRLQAEFSTSKTLEAGSGHDPDRHIEGDALFAEARHLKAGIREIEEKEHTLVSEIEVLAIALPNLTSKETPRGTEPVLLGYINADRTLTSSSNSHVHIGTELGVLDLGSASATSGWGWYFLKNEGALLEQALVQYALSVTLRHGFSVTSPPSMIYSHIAFACGYRPRDQGGEQQIYTIAHDDGHVLQRKPELCLAGTAEIPFAGMKANTELESSELPMKIVGSSRCYRAEAGSRGTDTKGLYRVHEFTKVEMFGWTLPDGSATDLFDEMMSIQREILESLGLRCRILEQPSVDLGASAARKQDIETYFPSRQARDEGWGEVTSTSICTDYQSRRLATRARTKSGKLVFPYTVNGTAMAIPRIVAAILENFWIDSQNCVHIPEVLWPWMHGIKVIQGSRPIAVDEN